MMLYRCRFCGEIIEGNADGKTATCLKCDVMFRDTSKLEPYVQGVADKDGAEVRGLLPSSIKTGDTVKFGRYEQGNGILPVEWQVINKREDRALLISKYALDSKRYNELYADVSWESCTLREWLNEEFFDTAFNVEEKAAIISSHVPAERNPAFTTSPGRDTEDRVFLLSLQECRRYFRSDADRLCRATEHARNKGAWVNDNGGCWWWLRTPGWSLTHVVRINNFGAVNEPGNYANIDGDAVRPALWVGLDR